MAEGRSCAPELEAGGALQVTFKQLELDYYPYHLAYGDRRHWVRYGESIPAQWLDQALSEFRARLTALLLNGGPHHTRLARAPPHLNNTVRDRREGRPTSTTRYVTGGREGRPTSTTRYVTGGREGRPTSITG